MLRFWNQESVAGIADALRNDRFEAFFPTINGYSPIVEDVNITFPTFEYHEIPYGSRDIFYASAIKNASLTAVFYVDISGETLNYIAEWKRLVRDPRTHLFGYADDYKRNAVIYIYGPDVSGLAGGLIGGVVDQVTNTINKTLRLDKLSNVASNITSKVGLGSVDLKIKIPPIALPSIKIKLDGIWPKGGESLQLKYSGKPDRVKLSVNFAIDAMYPVPQQVGRTIGRLYGGALFSASDLISEGFTQLI